ncbi:MAG: hypothetical protein U1F10_07530 [Burkholderiales bacterium]
MTDVRRLFSHVATALVAVAFSLFAGAASAQKIYTLEVSAVDFGTAQIKISNVSPPSESNSTINSFRIRAPGTVLSAVGVSQPSANVTTSGSTVTVKNFSGIKAYPLTPSSITVNVSLATCTSGTWYADVYTGNSLNGNLFSQTPSAGTTFAFDCLTLKYAAGANGTLTINGNSVTSYTQVVPRGTNGPVVTAAPNTNYRFAGWSDNNATTNPRQDTSVQSNVNATANFAALPYITVTAGAGGSISPASGYVAYGSSPTYTITPSATYRIASVTVDSVSQAAPYPTSVPFANVTADHSVGATFAQNTLTITPQSAPAVAGQGFTVAVGFDGPSPASLSLQTTCTTNTVATQSVTNPGTTPVSFTVVVPTPDSCTFTAQATNYAPKSLTTPLTIYTGTLPCSGTASSDPTVDVTKDWSYPQGNTILSNGAWSLVRGHNKPESAGDCTGAVPYTFTLTATTTPQAASFIVPSSEPQKVAAQYVVVWAPVATTNGWYEKHPQVGWAKDGSGNPVYMKALACIQDPSDFPNYPRANLWDLMPLIPNVAPYNQEPLLSTYGVNVKAKMCVSQHGWTAIGPANTDGTNTLVQSWDKIIDLGDGFVIND